jgi:hypothetical protein
MGNPEASSKERIENKIVELEGRLLELERQLNLNGKTLDERIAEVVEAEMEDQPPGGPIAFIDDVLKILIKKVTGKDGTERRVKLPATSYGAS